MSEEYMIEKGIPVARSSWRTPSPVRRALRAMEVGDSVKLGLSDIGRSVLSSIMTAEGKAVGKKFVCRTIHATETEPKHYRVWRVK